MKLAIIILCHKNITQINSIINALSSKDIQFFIHIDRKARLNEGEFVKEQVHILPYNCRENVIWGTNSMIKAVRSTLNYMVSSGFEYEYVCLLSGEDYPLVKPSTLLSFLETAQGANYIDITTSENTLYPRYEKRISVYYPRWFMGKTHLQKLCKHVYIYFTGGWKHTWSFCKRKVSREKKFYYGSQWWCVSKDFITYSLLSEESEKLLTYFEHALVPDESYYQTLIMNSPFSNTVKPSLHYINWENQKNNPAYFNELDMDRLNQYAKKYMFARKFKEDFPFLSLKRL